MSDKPFRFKQFEIHQSHSAMKVGTDGVLLAAWANVKDAKKILDVGTGTGVIALICAQRNSESLIDAIEIDAGSANDARANFSQSSWRDRLNLVEDDFLHHTFDQSYDLIISNPPYFTHSLRATNPSRNAARHDDSMPASEFLKKASGRLNDNGLVSVIFPKDSLERWSEEAHNFGLNASRVCHVFTLPTKDSVRVMVEFSRNEIHEAVMESILIETRRGEISEAYKQMVKDYYIKW